MLFEGGKKSLIFHCLKVHVSLLFIVNPIAISMHAFALCPSVFVHPYLHNKSICIKTV